MGWKNLKEAYQIKHSVTVEGNFICIGSGYVHNLLMVDSRTGEIHPNSTFSDFGQRYYPELLTADPTTILELVREPDQFRNHRTIYTYEDGDIIECLCEKPGYPNNTHDGRLITDNTFSTDRATVVEWAKRDLALWVSNLIRRKAELEKDLAETSNNLAHAQAKLADLNQTEHPDGGNTNEPSA